MKKLTCRQFGAATGAIAAASIIPERARAAEVLKFGHITDETNSWHQGAVEFGRLVEEKTAGEVVIEIYPDSSIGTERELLEGIPLGLADLSISSDRMAQGEEPSILLMSHRFTFRDPDHALKFLERPIAERIETELTETVRLRLSRAVAADDAAACSSRRPSRSQFPRRATEDASSRQGWLLDQPGAPGAVGGMAHPARPWNGQGAHPRCGRLPALEDAPGAYVKVRVLN